jgi:hypothetical protein
MRKPRNAGLRWADFDMVELTKRYEKKMEYEDIANHLGRSVSAIRSRLGILRVAYKIRSRIKELAPVIIPRPRKKAGDRWMGATSKSEYETSKDEVKIGQKELMVQYADNEDGAFLFLENETPLKRSKMSNAYVDPVVDGCWKITNVTDGSMVLDCVIHMSGYKNPFGKTRSTNDFESMEIT